jgi:predicted nucleotidyltransferase
MNNIVQQHLSQIKELMQQYGVQRAWAFGSAVKNTMHSDSDADFIISFPETMDYETYGNNYFSLLYGLQDLLKKNVDLITEKTLKNPYLLQSINHHKVQIL